MAGEWTETILNELIEAGEVHLQTGPFGTALKAAEYSDEGVPLISVGEIRQGYFEVGEKTPRVGKKTIERLPKFVLEIGDIVFGRKGGIDRNAIVRSEQRGWFLGSDGIRLRLSTNKHSSLFFSYQMQSPAIRKWILQNSEGTTMPSLNQEILGRVPIVIPPLSEQKAIAQILGTLDDKIELNRKMNATLEAMAQTIFKSWFVDFDPVKAKAERRSTGMPSHLTALFPDHFEGGDFGEIPVGWRYQPLGSLIDLQRGNTYKSSLKGLPGPVLLGLASIERNGGFRDDKLSTYGGESPTNLILKPGDLFASLKDVTQSADLLGAVAKVPPHISEGRLTQDTVKLIFKTEKCSRQVVYRTLLTPSYRDYCRSHATGTTNLGLSRDDFLAYPILQPSEPILRVFDAHIDTIENAVNARIAQSCTIAALRDSLLPKLISGQLRIPDIEQAKIVI
jgi:type I restriction enzyme, S subunit